MTDSVCSSDRARIEWCIAVLRGVADLGRPVLGDKYPETLLVIDALKRVLEPNIETPS